MGSPAQHSTAGTVHQPEPDPTQGDVVTTEDRVPLATDLCTSTLQ